MQQQYSENSGGAGCATRMSCVNAKVGSLETERSLVELDLVLAADLVGDLLPRRRDRIGPACRATAGIDLGELIFRDTVVLKMPGMRGSIAALG